MPPRSQQTQQQQQPANTTTTTAPFVVVGALVLAIVSVRAFALQELGIFLCVGAVVALGLYAATTAELGLRVDDTRRRERGAAAAAAAARAPPPSPAPVFAPLPPHVPVPPRELPVGSLPRGSRSSSSIESDRSSTLAGIELQLLHQGAQEQEQLRRRRPAAA